MQNMPLSALEDFHDFEPEEEDFRGDVIEGLSKPDKTLPCKFFYDARGSRLFEEICALDAYYPTRIETGLLERYAGEIADLAGPGCHLIELGSGASIKVRLLIDALVSPRSYVPVDISREHLINAAASTARDHADIDVVAVCADYTKPIDFPELGEGPRIGFFPGSTIGNFTPEDAANFLRQVHDWLLGGSLVIGVDLMKKETLLEAAYNDPKGVTEAFNKNLLVRCNKELGSTFDLDLFEHQAKVNVDQGRVEMHLVSKKDQKVRVCERTFSFAEGETIHTENSYKYTLEQFKDLASQAGFVSQKVWCDPDNLFSIHYLAVA
jgi:L-histidine Nalpha-methyltransferase